MMGRKQKQLATNVTPGCNIAAENTQESKIVIDINQKEKYDASNPLVLISNKKKTRVEKKLNIPVKQPLSKKQRRKLEKIIETKKKKLNRVELFQKLSEVQATTEDLNQLTSTADMQTFGIKRLTAESDSNIKRRKISNIRGINKKSVLSIQQKRTFKEDTDSSSSNSEEEMSGAENQPLTTEDERKVDKSLIECNSQNQKSAQEVNEEKSKVPPEEIFNTPNFENNSMPTVFVPVHRQLEIQAAREALPIYSEEQPLIEAIKENDVVIIHGETGSGKTTQVPQFLYEAGFTQNNMLIGITEPRRIAAMSMAARVGEEMNMPNAVSYHIRYEKTVNPETEIKFMTDGVLLQEMKNDFYLSKYSVIIIDEAHERSINSDVLIGLLSHIVRRDKKKNYPPLKLIIMSATMCVEEFMENPRLFQVPPFLFRVNSRQYTVQAHFNKSTPRDYIEAAYNKVCKIHKQLPLGAILVFLTGEKEIKQLCKMLRDTFPCKELPSEENDIKRIKLPDSLKKRKKRHKKEQFVPDINLDEYTIEPLDIEDLQHQLSEDEEFQADGCKINTFEEISPLHTLPLYSFLPFEEQEKIFKPPPPGSRLCVISTNVAETSITIPGLKYVVDSGKVKQKVYDKNSGGVSKFVITWCSKASANQRTGRAGRTEGGHCYRLYSSAVFENEFPNFSAPEIKRTPADDVLLQMKALGIPRVVDFPFPSPPDTQALRTAERRLVLLEALEDLQQKGRRYRDSKQIEFSAPVTNFGKAMAHFPLSPRYAAMLLLSKKHDCIPYVAAIVCAMTVSEVFLTSTISVDKDEDADKNNENVQVTCHGIKKIGAGKGSCLRLGDAMVFLRAVALYEKSKKKVAFCNQNGIRLRAMVEIHKMVLQLLKEMNQAFTNLKISFNLELEHLTEEIIENIRKIMSAGFIDHIAKKLPIEESKKDKKLKNAYKCMELEEYVFIHPSSILFSELPEYVVYQEIIQTSKYFMKGVVEIEDYWIPGIARSLCEFSEPLQDPPPYYDSEKDKMFVTMDVTVGRWMWEILAVKTEMPKGALRYKWFCFFFLDGQIFDFIGNYKQLTSPSVVLKKWAETLAPKMMLLLNALISKDVDSKRTLENVWNKDSTYLLKEFLGLLPVNKHFEVENKWPPMS